MLNNLRNSLQPHLEKIGKGFASTGISPNGWSCIGLIFAFVSAFIYGWNVEFSLIIGGIVLLVAGFFDIVDGQVARVSQKITRSGGFLDSVFDKIAEVALFSIFSDYTFITCKLYTIKGRIFRCKVTRNRNW